MMNGLQDMMRTLNSEGGIASVMKEDAFEGNEGQTFSQADLIADVINILRMDQKRIAQEHGVDLEINQMTPERAAQLLEAVAKGEAMKLVAVFDRLEDQRMTLLEEIAGEDETDEYISQKKSVLYTTADTSGEPETEAAADTTGDNDENA